MTRRFLGALTGICLPFASDEGHSIDVGIQNPVAKLSLTKRLEVLDFPLPRGRAL